MQYYIQVIRYQSLSTNSKTWLLKAHQIQTYDQIALINIAFTRECACERKMMRVFSRSASR